MDANQYIAMLQDEHFYNLKKMEYKYSKESVQEMLAIVKKSLMKPILLPDFSGESFLVYSDVGMKHTGDAIKALMSYRGKDAFGLKSLENEIISTFSIEQINTSRESVRKILAGTAPNDESENCILGMKKGFEFISDKKNRISADNVRVLYEMMINPYLSDVEDRLMDQQLYRNGSVSIVSGTSGKVIHSGIDASKLYDRMDALFLFLDSHSEMDDLSKATCLHFYISFLHPYFDGNGRMARMLHLWYLIQKGYSAVLFLPFSSLIQKSKKEYYKAFDLIEQNAKISGLTDITPFLKYFNEYVYKNIGEYRLENHVVEEFLSLLDAGVITEKEKYLFNFVISYYGEEEFSTKQIERDFGKCAYATIRSFVLKLTEYGIFDAHLYGNRTKYCLADSHIAAKKDFI